MEKNFLEEMDHGIKHWYIPLIIGVLLVALSVWTVLTPVESYLALSIVFAIVFFINGVFSAYFSLAFRGAQWGWSFAWGMLGIILGVLLISSPALSAVTLALYVGFMLLFYSVMGLSIAIDIKQRFSGGGTDLLVLSVLGIILSFIMLWEPAFGGLSIVIWTSFAFFVIGIYAIALSFRLKKIDKELRM